jgi:hypothetical protein
VTVIMAVAEKGSAIRAPNRRGGVADSMRLAKIFGNLV